MHTFAARHVLYASTATEGPLGVQVYLNPNEWRTYEGSAERRARVTYTLLDGTSHQHIFGDVGQVDLIQEEGFDPFYKLNFWFETRV